MIKIGVVGIGFTGMGAVFKGLRLLPKYHSARAEDWSDDARVWNRLYYLPKRFVERVRAGIRVGTTECRAGVDMVLHR